MVQLQAPLTLLRYLITLGKDRASFMLIISQYWITGSDDYKMIEKAYDINKDAFRGIERDDKVRYFEHPRQVALIAILYQGVRDAERVAAILSHDLVEDSEYWTLQRIEKEFNANVALRVEYFTKEKITSLSSRQLLIRYFGRLEGAPDDIIEDKLTDRMHNLLTLSGNNDKERELRKIDETIRHLLPLAARVNKFYWEFIFIIYEHQLRLEVPTTICDYLPPGMKIEDIK